MGVTYQPHQLASSISNGDTTHAIDGNSVFDALALKPDATSFVSSSFPATFDQSVGAKTILVHLSNKLVTLEIPSGTTSDGGGAAISSGATDIPAQYRPQSDVSFSVVVTNATVLVAGKLVIKSSGQLVFSAGIAGTLFTDNLGAGFDRRSVSYIIA